MIIVRSPLRITLGGGGTDLPSYYRYHDGFLVAAAIDKYVYITLHRTFYPGLIVKYSELERAESAGQVKHPIVREALQLAGVSDRVEITSMADIPAGTGMGSSSSFTTALLKALHTHRNVSVGARQLAEQACQIELQRLGEPIGKQDQYAAAFGGVTCFSFNRDDTVDVEKARLSPETLANLEDGICLFFTGVQRSASAILKEQDAKSKANDQSMIDNLHYVKELGQRSYQSLCKGDLIEFGKLMDEHWQHKKKRSGGMSSPHIDQLYEVARQNGAIGGKLIGAGGGGFLMFYTEDKRRLRHAILEKGLEEIRFRFDFEGTKVLVQ